MPIISIPNSIGGVSIPGNVLKGPLGALFGNKYDLQNLRYPKDLESATRGHVVKFSINEVQPVGYEENKTYSVNSIASGIGQSVGNVASAAYNSAADYLGLNKVGDGNTKVELSLQPSKKKLAATISLYMPDTMNFTYQATYNDINLTSVAKSTLDNTVGKIPKVGKLITGTIESDASKLLLRSQGLAINPNQQVMFDGIQLRTYQLAFTFTPYSKQEAEEVKKIIETFKLYSRPRTIEGTGGMLFIPPATFDLQFLFNGKENPNVNKVAESVIETIDVNYAPNGWATHSDGAPVQTTLTMNFKEVKLIDRNGLYGVDKGY